MNNKNKNNNLPKLEPVTFISMSQANVESLLSDMSNSKSPATLYRDDIICEICSILISGTKPNALLIGPAGSGKTNIVEELARRIKRKHKGVPSMLYGYRIYSLGLSDIISGCGIVGELERKVRDIVDYLANDDNKAILFLDEVHMLFSGESYKKVAQMIKPALSRGNFKVIAATTTQEVKKIDEDPAFSRRFTRVLVNELTKEQTEKILSRVKTKLEKHYERGISFDKDTASLLVRTADEFCAVGSHRPDNALTLMDRAVAAKVLKMQKEGQDGCIFLDENVIEETAFRMTSGNSCLKRFDEVSFKNAVSHIRGQDDILEDITRTLKLYDLHLRPRKKPLTFLFAGPSGAGKSEAAKVIASEYIGEKPIVLNMAEFNSSASINRIIGAPSGYVGSDSNRELPFDALDTNPYQVILLDEFEKCDRSVQRLFMSVFDEGTMKTNVGKEIDFSKTIIIATTNAGCTAKVKAIGFGAGQGQENLTTSDLAGYFDVELISRFSRRYTFHEISRKTYLQVVRDMLATEIGEVGSTSGGRAARVYLENSTSETDVEHLVDASYDPKLGARPAQTAVRDYVDGMLLKMIDENCIKRPPKTLGDKKKHNDCTVEYKKEVITVA
ncbi:AAA family ATPase [Butyrivibrio sp. NC2002]|uniref:AAA family ATPase n=1 Tax=Butyrivibrio sp. NC2002 TaxID=1410610 RepID=UPI000691F1DE|nr:AAA family ATPase [Butyrivibrio sp. NC2002]